MTDAARHRSLTLVAITSAVLIAVAVLVQLSSGAYKMEWRTVVQSVFSRSLLHDTTYLPWQLLGERACRLFGIEKPLLAHATNEALIVWNIRIPRLLIGLCVGANLAIAGCIFQTITKNDMSSAYTLGISQGSGLSMLIILIAAPGLYAWLPVLSMAGGLAAFGLIYWLAWKNGTTPARLVLSGVIIGSISIAIQKALYYFVQDIGVFQDVLSWTTGSLIGLSWPHFRMIFPWTCLVLAFCLTLHRPLDLLLLGDGNAKALGVPVEKWRLAFAIVGILAASSAVCVAGLIGFVGLIAPHIGKMLVGYSHKSLFTACALIGATLLAVSDTVARVILPNGQIPVGIILNTIGGVFFIALMRRDSSFKAVK